MSHTCPVHIGLVGHIDHGKTELARALSEHVSTAGLDRHPQARERGITIDLGFTMFRLGEFMVTLVDAPGHADLIRSVVAGASIMDAALVVVAADEGPKVQTGEHIVVLRAMGVSDVVVVVTKTDLATPERVEEVVRQMRAIVRDAGWDDAPVVRVCALTGEGVDDLRQVLLQHIRPRPRDTGAPLLMPIDHAFPVRGHGTVVTGTILGGRLTRGSEVELMPQGVRVRVRGIQTFGQERHSAVAGDRVGVNVPDVDHRLVHRGRYLSGPGLLRRVSGVVVHLQMEPLYRGCVTRGMTLSATIGMPTVSCEIVPFITEAGAHVRVEQVTEGGFGAVLLLRRQLAATPGMRVLLMRPDLPPTAMRIVAWGEVTDLPQSVTLVRRRRLTGRVLRVRASDVLVEGLFSRREAAQRAVGDRVVTESGVSGTLLSAFGTRGVVAVSFAGEVSRGEPVLLEQSVEEVVQLGH